MPGPLLPSKRLYRTLTGSSMPPPFAEGGVDSQRTPTFSSALTDAWNNSASSKCPSGNPTSQSQARTTCLFCSNLVLINGNFSNSEDTKKRSRMLRNLCVHAQISSKDIPNSCSKAKFPLCKLCDELVTQLWDFQVMLDKIKVKISEVVGKIERTVVDGEILNPKIAKPVSSLMAALEEEKFLQLRNMILDGYRNKLIMKQQIQNNLVLSNPISSLRLNGISVKVECNTENDDEERLSMSSSLNLDPPSIDRCEELFDINLNDLNDEIIELPEISPVAASSSPPPIVGQNSPDILPTFEQHRQSFSSASEEGSLQIDEQEGCEPEGDSDWTVDPAVIAQYNDSSSTLVISNIQGSGETETRANPPEEPVPAPSLVQIKQEINNGDHLVELDVDGDDDEDFDSDDDEIYMLENRKRRQLFGNVEFFKCYGNSKHGGESLQCSLCDHKIPIPKKACRGDVTPIMKMKLHIQSIHRREAVIPVGKTAPPKRLHTCAICSKTFTRREYLREHKKRHPPQATTECDICGRPIKSTSHFNLLLHKFSHKNDEERMAAIAAGEKGTSATFLSSRKFKPKKGKTKPKRKEMIKRGQSQKTDVQSLKCNICSRVFGRQCYLTLHMKAHISQSNLWSNIPILNEEQGDNNEPPVLLAQEVSQEISQSAQNENEHAEIPPGITQQCENNARKSVEIDNSFVGSCSNISPVLLPILKREVVD